MRRIGGWTAAVVVAGLMLIIPVGVLATNPGENGKIAFVSGRGAGANDDTSADVYILDGLNDPSASQLTSVAGQHRHPDWAPDLARIAYAVWNGDNDQKVWVHDLGTGGRVRLGIHSSLVRDDRPSWSPDGRFIAYESEVVDGSGQMDILVVNVETNATVNLTATPTLIEGKPVWSSDQQWIYYSRRPMPPNFDDDILRERSDNSSPFPEFITTSATAEYQASISPNGRRICYTRGAFGSTEADVWIRNLTTGNEFDLSVSSIGAYNCAWSPNGQFVTYVEGVFTGGQLVYKPWNGPGGAALPIEDVASHFDGNPAWAPLRPALCQGIGATMAGTDGNDSITGTNLRDVIVTFGGRDTVNGLQGNDLVCGGGAGDTLNGGDGNDDLFGGAGPDRLVGGNGNDELIGGGGNDSCSGGPGMDVLNSC